MKNNDPNDRTTSLHLGKFAPGSAPAADETVSSTMSVKLAASKTAEEEKIAMPKDSGALPPQDMLGAVSYCYAKGVYSSEEIEARMLRDPKLREAVHGEIPRAGAIRRFRVLNADAIRTTLEKAFRFMRKGQCSSATSNLKPTRANPSPEQPSGEATVIMVRREATERLNQATFIDNMSKE